MKKILSILLIIPLFLALSCEKDKKETNDSLYVKFYNAAGSTYTISNIQLRARGDAGTTETIPPGEWSANILKDGKTLAPGEFTFFTLDIPSGEWSEYRVGVLVNANEVMLHEQIGYSGGFEPSITHWGGDNRTVEVTIQDDTFSNLIVINGFSDWVGID